MFYIDDSIVVDFLSQPFSLKEEQKQNTALKVSLAAAESVVFDPLAMAQNILRKDPTLAINDQMVIASETVVLMSEDSPLIAEDVRNELVYSANKAVVR